MVAPDQTRRRPRRRHRFTNWARNHRSYPEAVHHPATDEDVAVILRRAGDEGTTARAVGAGHSWTAVACTDGHLLRLDRLARVLEIDTTARRVTVEAGIRLADLSARLSESGLGLSNLGSISVQSVAGAISTATHGTGIGFGNLATQVVAMRLVTPQGRIVDLAAGRDDDLLRAARVSLGCLGIITRVTLQCEPTFNLEERSNTLSFDEAMGCLIDEAASHEHVKAWWLPHTDKVWLNRFNRTTASPTPGLGRSRWIDEHIVTPLVFAPLLRLGRVAPALIPPVNRLVARTHFRALTRVDWAPHIFNVYGVPRHYETEWAIPVEATVDALRRLRALIADEGLRVNFIVEVRFVRGDDSYLSPDVGRDSCRLGAYMYPSRGWRRYFDAFEALMMEYDGRPHWGKAYRFESEYLRRVYPDFARFDAAREELDPSGTLGNAFTRTIFG